MSQPLHERIPLHVGLANDDPCYWEPEIRAAATTVVDLPGGLLAVDARDRLSIRIALFAWAGGPAIDAETNAEVAPNTYQLIMHGEGPGVPLRELRHTYWGAPDNSGYIFYPSAKLICGALEALKRWFDV